jgi:hypothetical protein
LPVQLRLGGALTSEEYVRGRFWEKATLERCPAHPTGGCTFRRHSSYPRKWPAGARIARYYCPTAHQTFSLLPDFLASHLSGPLCEVEQVAALAESGISIEALAERLRPDVQLPGAVRWVRRRLGYVRRAISVGAGLLPALLAGVEHSVRSFSVAFGVSSGRLLECLRAWEGVAEFLVKISSPFGFRRRLRRRTSGLDPDQHTTGPVPPGPAPYGLHAAFERQKET